MKKGLLARVLKMGLVFASVYTGIFGYIINLNTVYAISEEDKPYVFIDRLQYEEEQVEEEKAEESVLEETIVDTRVGDTYSVYVPPATSNTISYNIPFSLIPAPTDLNLSYDKDDNILLSFNLKI